MPRGLLAWMALSVLGAVAGCGGSGSASASDPDRMAVKALVSSLPDQASTPKRAAEVFADAKPDAETCRRIAAYMFVPESIQVAGDSATIQVKVYNAETSLEVAASEWTAVKRDGQWKLQSAPIP